MYHFYFMSQQKEDALINESIDCKEKDNNQDQDVVSSDDDVIDYSVKPELYDPNLDDKDQLWIQKKRKGQYSDAVLTCPACFTTLCLESQRHEKYVTQYRAMFVLNCKIKKGQHVSSSSSSKDKGSLKRKRVRKSLAVDGESFTPVCCSVCETEVGVIDDDECCWEILGGSEEFIVENVHSQTSEDDTVILNVRKKLGFNIPLKFVEVFYNKRVIYI
ncbi:unnamed protein product [Lactuca saligna]|uniref:E2F-associated phosphoprotein n=1 Tax=Lactuca saligna TaxID=75948 RepID=A0AA36E317_LACSI|nr:unnamed protein product [Lactuca saligna]